MNIRMGLEDALEDGLDGARTFDILCGSASASASGINLLWSCVGQGKSRQVKTVQGGSRQVKVKAGTKSEVAKRVVRAKTSLCMSGQAKAKESK